MKKNAWIVLVLPFLLTACTGPANQVTPTPEPPAVTTTPEPQETWSPVYTDWSQFTPRAAEKPVYTRRYADYTDSLIPAGDYGPLLSFAGVSMATHYPWDEEGTYYDDSFLYGLVTRSGEVVVDPVFASVTTLESRDNHGNPLGGPTVLVLSKTFQGEDGTVEVRSALADPQGRWCTGYDYFYEWEMGGMGQDIRDGITIEKVGHRVALVDPWTGEERWEADFSPYWPQIDPENEYAYLSSFYFDPAEGWCTVEISYSKQAAEGQWEYGSIPLLFDPSGEPVRLDLNVQWVGRFSGGLAPAQDYYDAWGYIDTDGQWAIPPRYHMAQPFENGAALVRRDSSSWFFIDREGSPLMDGVICDYVEHHGDYWYFLGYSGDAGAVYDADHKKIDSPLVNTWTEVAFLPEAWVSTNTGDSIVVARGMDAYYFSPEWGRVADLDGDRLLFQKFSDDFQSSVFRLTDWEGNVLAQWDKFSWGYLTRRQEGERPYFGGYISEGESVREEYYDLDGNLILELKSSESLRFGLVTDLGGYSGHSSMRTLAGETVFYWPIPAGID